MSAEYYETALSLTANASDIRLAIKALVVDNTPYGWTHVEDYTESSTTWTVLKCPTTSSGLPNDFHVVIAHPQTAGSEISFFVCEGYDTTAHRMQRPHLNHSSTITPPAGADGSVGDDNTLYRPTTGATAAARTAGTGLSGSHCAPVRFTFSSTAVIGVAFYDDGMNITLKASLKHAIYCGAFTSFVKEPATNDPMPVGIFNFASITSTTNYTTSAFQGAATRSAMNAGLSGIQSLNLQPWHGWGQIVDLSTSTPTNEATWDKYAATPGPYLEPLCITRHTLASNIGITAATLGFLRGRLPYVLHAGVSGTWGDTIDVGTDRYQSIGSTETWIYIGPVPA